MRHKRTLTTIALTAALTALAIIGALAPPNPAAAQTNGQITPCPGSPYNNGWFDTWNLGMAGAVNCSQHDNHIVLDTYNARGQRTQAIVDLWYGAQCDTPTYIQPNPGLPFRINLRNNSYGHVWAPGCGTQGATIQTDTATIHGPTTNPIDTTHYGTWWSARVVNTTWPQTINMCYITDPHPCTQLDGYTVVNPHGINNGPFVAVGFGGASPNGRPHTYITSISIHINS